MNIRFPGARPRAAALLLAAGLLASAAALAVSGQQRDLVEGYLKAVGDGEISGVISSALHTGDVEQFRTRVLQAMDAEKAEGRSAIRDRLFGNAASLEELRRLTPPNFMLAMTRRIAFPAVPARAVQVIDVVEENGSTQHAVARVWPDEKKKGTSRLALVTLRKMGDKAWRVGIPDEFLALVDAALARSAAPPAAAGTADRQAATNPAEILQLVESGSKLLRDGNCASYYTVLVSPNFRASKSDKALKTLIAQCERSIDMREMYVSALELVGRSAPDLRDDGKRAVYDLKGQGLPFNTFTLEKVGDRWYVAE